MAVIAIAVYGPKIRIRERYIYLPCTRISLSPNINYHLVSCVDRKLSSGLGGRLTTSMGEREFSLNPLEWHTELQTGVRSFCAHQPTDNRVIILTDDPQTPINYRADWLELDLRACLCGQIYLSCRGLSLRGHNNVIGRYNMTYRL